MAVHPNPIMITGVNHVVYLVKDLGKSMQYYNGFLGIPQIPRQVDLKHIIWLRMPNGIMLHLIQSDEAPCPRENHIAFQVDDLEATMKGVEDEGYRVERTGVRNDGQKFFFTLDPDGNSVEFCTASGF